MKQTDKAMAWAFSALLALLIGVVLIVGYIAIFKHQNCITRQECHEIVDSILIQIYD